MTNREYLALPGDLRHQIAFELRRQTSFEPLTPREVRQVTPEMIAAASSWVETRGWMTSGLQNAVDAAYFEKFRGTARHARR